MRRAYEEREYRRGLILGLTMAEVLILLLFLLLLTLSITILRDRQRFADERASFEARITGLERTNRQLAPLAERLRQGGTMTDAEAGEMLSNLAHAIELESALRQAQRERDQVRSERDALVAVLQQIDPSAPPEVTLRRAAAALAEARQLRESLQSAQQRIVEQQSQLTAAQGARDEAVRQRQAMDDVTARAQEINPDAPPAATLRQGLEALAQQHATENAPPSDPRRQLGELQQRFADLQQQRDRVVLERDNLMRRFGGGRGLTWPSCFITEGGGSQSIFRITVNDGSVRVQDLGVQPQHEVWRLPRAAAFRGHTDEGSRGQFQALFTELFNWSAAHDCRFIVRLSDATCESCKQEWNSGRLWVGGFFYPNER
jgi:hypothetical protein